MMMVQTPRRYTHRSIYSTYVRMVIITNDDGPDSAEVHLAAPYCCTLLLHLCVLYVSSAPSLSSASFKFPCYTHLVHTPLALLPGLFLERKVILHRVVPQGYLPASQAPPSPNTQEENSPQNEIAEALRRSKDEAEASMVRIRRAEDAQRQVDRLLQEEASAKKAPGASP